MRALEEILFSVESPRILHLATHGYFLKDEEAKELLSQGFDLQEIEMIPGIGIENPMLRSGIVLAGVNTSLREGRDDGMVSAEKILGLRLKGTEIVVLSACETGVGDVRNGEGVFGLKRAFILSGAKTIVMSLWSVPSKETTELMTRFYTLMSEGKTKAEALGKAKLDMMKKKVNPFYWGAFILVGKPE
jgi:CHAT domain-containing protein